VKARKVFRCEQAAVVLHVIADAPGDGAFIKIIARGHQASMPVRSRSLRSDDCA